MINNELIQTIFLVLSVAALAGGAIGIARAARNDAVIKGQAQLISVRDLHISDQDKQIAALTAERDSLKLQVETLTGLAQGSPKLQEILDYMKQRDSAL